MPNKTFLDSAGLSTFLNNLKSAYAGNDTNAFSTFTVAKAGKADQLTTARTVTFATGDVTGSFSFDGSANVSDVVLSVADAVASTSGAGGSHGLMTAAQAEKLAGIAAGAEANVLEGVQLKNNGDADFSDLSISNKKVQIDLSGYALKTDISAVMKFKGTKTSDELAALTGMETGDVYQVVSGGTGTAYNVGSEYAYNGSSWVELGPAIDLSGFVEKTQKVNNKALSGDITLDGSDIALSTNYAVASTAAAPAAGDSIDTAVGKLQKEVADASAAATTYAFAEGSTDGAFQVTPTVGGVTGTAQSVAIHGLGSAAYAATTDFVPSNLTPAEAGAEANVLEGVQLKNNGDADFADLTISNKKVQIDLSGYALSSQLPSAATAIADSDTGYATGDQVYDYIEAHKSEWGDANVIESISVNGTAQTITNKNVDITVPTQASAIADNDTGYATGDQVYDYIEALPISDATINGLFGISS